MSAHKNSNEDIPRLEPWLAVLASSMLPVLAGLFLSSSLVVPAVVLSVLLFATGLVMLRRQTSQRRLNSITSVKSEG